MLDMNELECPDMVDVLEGTHFREKSRFYCMKRDKFFMNVLDCCMDCDFFRKVYQKICKEFGIENG